MKARLEKQIKKYDVSIGVLQAWIRRAILDNEIEGYKRRLDKVIAKREVALAKLAVMPNDPAPSPKKRVVRKPTIAMITDIRQQLEEHTRLFKILFEKHYNPEPSPQLLELSHICADVTLKLQAVAVENSELRAQLQAQQAQLIAQQAQIEALTTKPKSVFNGPGFPQYKPATSYIPDPI
jgi:hypothetical protein